MCLGGIVTAMTTALLRQVVNIAGYPFYEAITDLDGAVPNQVLQSHAVAVPDDTPS